MQKTIQVNKQPEYNRKKHTVTYEQARQLGDMKYGASFNCMVEVEDKDNPDYMMGGPDDPLLDSEYMIGDMGNPTLDYVGDDYDKLIEAIHFDRRELDLIIVTDHRILKGRVDGLMKPEGKMRAAIVNRCQHPEIGLFHDVIAIVFTEPRIPYYPKVIS